MDAYEKDRKDNSDIRGGACGGGVRLRSVAGRRSRRRNVQCDGSCGIRNMIRDSKTYQIDTVIQTSAAEGMISMDQSLLRLYKEGKITEETALEYAVGSEQMKRKL